MKSNTRCMGIKMDRPKIKDLVKKYGCKDFFFALRQHAWDKCLFVSK